MKVLKDYLTQKDYASFSFGFDCGDNKTSVMWWFTMIFITNHFVDAHPMNLEYFALTEDRNIRSEACVYFRGIYYSLFNPQCVTLFSFLFFLGKNMNRSICIC